MWTIRAFVWQSPAKLGRFVKGVIIRWDGCRYLNCILNLRGNEHLLLWTAKNLWKSSSMSSFQEKKKKKLNFIRKMMLIYYVLNSGFCAQNLFSYIYWLWTSYEILPPLYFLIFKMGLILPITQGFLKIEIRCVNSYCEYSSHGSLPDWIFVAFI